MPVGKPDVTIVEPKFATLSAATEWMLQQVNPAAFFVVWSGATNQWVVTAILN